MANKFVKDRAALKAVTNGVSGDVYYLTDQQEVYDVVNTKLALPNTGCFKVASGVWAILNREKTLNYRLNKPNDHDQANKYTKGTLINYGGDLYIANADIAEDTTWATGTTGATWKKVAAGATVYTRAATETGSIPSLANLFSVDKNSKFDRAGALTLIRYPSTITSIGTGYAVIVRPSSSDVTTAFKTGHVWNVRKVFTLPANSSSLVVSGFDVTTQDYLGWVHLGGTNTAYISVTMDSFHLAYIASLNKALTEGQNVTIAATSAHQSGGLGWELTV